MPFCGGCGQVMQPGHRLEVVNLLKRRYGKSGLQFAYDSAIKLTVNLGTSGLVTVKAHSRRPDSLKLIVVKFFNYHSDFPSHIEILTPSELGIKENY